VSELKQVAAWEDILWLSVSWQWRITTLKPGTKIDRKYIHWPQIKSWSAQGRGVWRSARDSWLQGGLLECYRWERQIVLLPHTSWKHQEFRVMCSYRVHCENVFRMRSSESLFTKIFCNTIQYNILRMHIYKIPGRVHLLACEQHAFCIKHLQKLSTWPQCKTFELHLTTDLSLVWSPTWCTKFLFIHM
jgi:hypothetical protein